MNIYFNKYNLPELAGLSLEEKKKQLKKVKPNLIWVAALFVIYLLAFKLSIELAFELYFQIRHKLGTAILTGLFSGLIVYIGLIGYLNLYVRKNISSLNSKNT